MKFTLLTATTLFVSSFSLNTYAFCTDSVAPTVDTSNYILDSQNGVITDAKNGLMWSVCNHGENWIASDSRCDGSAESVIWQSALQSSTTTSLAGYDDWRVPNIKELMSLIERQCAEPAIPISLFASTENEAYWTSTPVYNTGTTNLVWAVHFKEGTNIQRDKSSAALIRFVRKVSNAN
ncbi:DUF1566 domain-containing protein [Catenovulum sediminis]|uniref:DUF1566 domain-containing protein n=1 Tax=Catenovulum sediminis TaxID=1740262 RepID=A0ABV1RJQ5_9ALTE